MSNEITNVHGTEVTTHGVHHVDGNGNGHHHHKETFITKVLLMPDNSVVAEITVLPLQESSWP